MKRFLDLFSHNATLFFILLVAITLRFFHYSSVPFTHDEFSAIFRLNFDSFNDLIEYGVKVDGHPPAVQVFLYYWSHLVGTSEIALKLPFTLMGVAAVYLTYKNAKIWYNKTVGLICAASVTALQYTVMYSLIARPYISGLFFSLLLVFAFTKLVKGNNKHLLFYRVLFIVAFLLCAYNHYFSFLFAIIVGFSIPFFVPIKEYSKFLIMAGIIFLLYAPYLPIFSHQLSLAGVGQWLAPPTPSFIINYCYYIFNYSPLFIVIIITIVVGAVLTKKHKKSSTKNTLLFCSWFLLPLIIGYIYSVTINPVLQYSVLIFSFTYLFFILFGHLKEYSVRTTFFLVLIILCGGVVSLIVKRDFYIYFYKSPYETIITDYQQNKSDKTISLIHAREDIINYYVQKHSVQPDYINLNTIASQHELNQVLQSTKKYNTLYLGATSSLQPDVVPIIMDYFPTLKTQQNLWGGTTFLFSKEKPTIHYIDSAVFHQPSDEWNFTKAGVRPNNRYLVQPSEKWGPSFESPLEDLITHKNNFIDVEVKISTIDTSFLNALLVLTLETENKTLYWRGIPVQTEKKNVKNSIRIHGTLKLSDIDLKFKNIKFKTFIWNKNNQSFYIEEYLISRRKGNPVIYDSVEK